MYGPFSSRDLLDMLDESLITLWHEVALEGMEAWCWLGDHLTTRTKDRDDEREEESGGEGAVCVESADHDGGAASTTKRSS